MLEESRNFVHEVIEMAKARGLNCFVLTDGMSGVTNSGNDAIRHARKAHAQWESKHGFDPSKDYGR